MLDVTPAQMKDSSAIADLLDEMDRFYGSTDSPPRAQRVAEIDQQLFGPSPAASVLLAWHDTRLAGLASYSFLWPAVGTTRSLYLKELYIRQRHQRSGIGTALMRAVARVAVDQKCSRLEWTADGDNTRAHAFYAALLAPTNPSKISYRLDAAALTTLADSQTQ